MDTHARAHARRRTCRIRSSDCLSSSASSSRAASRCSRRIASLAASSSCLSRLRTAAVSSVTCSSVAFCLARPSASASSARWRPASSSLLFFSSCSTRRLCSFSRAMAASSKALAASRLSRSSASLVSRAVRCCSRLVDPTGCGAERGCSERMPWEGRALGWWTRQTAAMLCAYA